MGAQERPPVSRLAQELQTASAHYGFFQLVWLLKRYQSQITHEPLKLLFRSMASLAFQPAEVAVLPDPGRPDRVIVETPFLGLYGLSTPLPLYYTEELLDDNVESQVLRGFLDLFNHRSHELLQAIWEKYRCHLRIRPAADDSTSEQVASLARLGIRNGYQFKYVDRRRLLPLTGMLSFATSSVRVIELVLRSYFGLSTLTVQENTLRYTAIPIDQRNSLGESQATLGDSLSIGEEVLDCSSSFSVVVVDVELEVALSFHPDRHAYREMRELVEFLSPIALDFDIVFQVRAASIDACGLGGQSQLGLGGLLGYCEADSIQVQF